MFGQVGGGRRGPPQQKRESLGGSEGTLNMRPGQLHPNELELAILERIAASAPAIRAATQALHVLSREFSGVGSFTNFQVNEAQYGEPERHLDLDALINVPGVPNGLGAVLFCKGDQPECLEICTYGDDHWDGVYVGFTIEPTA